MVKVELWSSVVHYYFKISNVVTVYLRCGGKNVVLMHYLALSIICVALYYCFL